MIVVVKLGGALLADPVAAARELAGFAALTPVIVHGGGLQISRLLEELRIPSGFIDGLRVTDDRALRGVVMALLGEVHSSLVSALQAGGLRAVGVFGTVAAIRRQGPWGHVGSPSTIDTAALSSLLQQGRIPVVPTMGIGSDGLLNINGDETAAAVAIALKADRLVFLTDVEGVRGAAGAVVRAGLTPEELLGSGAVSGGMVPKLRAVQAALDGGVAEVMVGITQFRRTE